MSKPEMTCIGFIASILEDKQIGNCSNGGISQYHNQVTIVSDVDECQIFDTYPVDELCRPIVVIKKRIIGGEEYVYAEPIDNPDKGNIGWMAGGTFIYSCDSRFSRHFSKYPIPLHDRQETREDFEVLSR